MKLWLQAKGAGSTYNYLIHSFATSHPQVYPMYSLWNWTRQDRHESTYGIVNIHGIDVVLAISYNGKVRVALKGKLAHKLCIKLTRRLIRPISAKEANNSGASGRGAMTHKCCNVLLCREFGYGVGQIWRYGRSRAHESA